MTALRRKHFGLLALTVVLLAVVPGSLLVASEWLATSVSVPAKAYPGVDSGVLIGAAQSVVVTASGSWSVGGIYGTGDANGDTTHATELCALLTSAPMRALIGSLDGGLTWFLIGTGPTTVAGPGQLLLSANDCPGPGGAFFLDNSGFLSVTITPTSETVEMDIKPGSDPNSINPESEGVISVAILTTDTFDATTVDPTTVLFGATGTEAAPVHAAFEDVDGDGDTDLILHFNTQETGIVCGDTSAFLTGASVGGQIEGSDSIKTVGCK